MQPYGGFWRRVVAYLIDAIISNFAVGVIDLIFGLQNGFYQSYTVISGNTTVVTPMSSGVLSGSGIGLGIGWLYFALMESSVRQATIGKLVMGMIVTDEDGARITFVQATGRFFAKLLSGLILGFGFFMIGWTQRKQGLHDILAHTLVYKTRDPRSVMTSASVFE